MSFGYKPRYRITTIAPLNHYFENQSPIKLNNAINQDENRKSALNQLIINIKERRWLLNHVSFKDVLQKFRSELTLDKHIDQVIKKLFPAHVEHLLNLQSNFFNKFPANSIVDIYSHGKKVYAEIIMLSKANEQTRILFHVGENGFEFIEYGSDSMADYESLMRPAQTNKYWHEQRDRNNWSWLEKHFKIFEPVFTDSYITPLDQRLNNAYNDIMNNNNPYKNSFTAFMGWPDDERYHNNATVDFSLKLAKYIFTGEFLTPIKNILKFGFEFIPAVLEESGSWLLDTSKKKLINLNTWKDGALAIGGILTGAVAYGVGKTVRQIGMRATSPVRSAKEAYEFGKKAHVLVGCLFAAASIALSALLIVSSSIYPAIKIALAIVKPKDALQAIAFTLWAAAAAILEVTAVVAGIGIKTGINNIWNKIKASTLNEETMAAKNGLIKSLHTEQSQTPELTHMSSDHSIRSALHAAPLATTPTVAPILPRHSAQLSAVGLSQAPGLFVDRKNHSEEKINTRTEAQKLKA